MIGRNWQIWSFYFLLQIRNFEQLLDSDDSSPFCTFTWWLFPNCPDFFPLFILNTPKGVFYSHPVLFRDALSWLILLLSKVLSYNREETAPLVLKQISMRNLTSTLMFSKTVSHATFWGRSSRKAGFVSYHLWSVSLSYLLYCHPCHHCQSIVCSSSQKNAKARFLGCLRLFSWCVHTLPKLQLQASTHPVTCFSECFRLYHSRLTPQHTIQNSAS